MDDGSGGLCCKPDSACKMGQFDEGKERSRAMCSAHQKVRSIESLVDDGAGGVCCKEGENCKATGEPKAKGYGKGGGKWGGWMMNPWMMQQMGGWGKGRGFQNRPTGPNLTRTEVEEEPQVGEVLEWKGKFGWIKPDIEVEHDSKGKHGGKIYISQKDIVGGDSLTAGQRVQYTVYSDADGLGGQNCSVI